MLLNFSECCQALILFSPEFNYILFFMSSQSSGILVCSLCVERMVVGGTL